MISQSGETTLQAQTGGSWTTVDQDTTGKLSQKGGACQSRVQHALLVWASHVGRLICKGLLHNSLDQQNLVDSCLLLSADLSA